MIVQALVRAGESEEALSSLRSAAGLYPDCTALRARMALVTHPPSPTNPYTDFKKGLNSFYLSVSPNPINTCFSQKALVPVLLCWFCGWCQGLPVSGRLSSEPFGVVIISFVRARLRTTTSQKCAAFRSGLVFKAQEFVYHSTLGVRVIK